MITCHLTQKSYHLNVGDRIRDAWAFRNGKWRKQKPQYRDEDWYEDYQYQIAATGDMLECWLNYFPGFLECDDYGDFSVTFNMEEVEEAGWSEHYLVDMLGDMVCHIKMRRVIHAEEPWETFNHDVWGNRRDYYRYPAIESLPGMLDMEYPHDLIPTG